MDPTALNTYLYIEKTPTWLVRWVHAFGLFAWLLVLYGYKNAILFDPFYRWVVAPILIVFTAYYLLSYGMNILFYRQHNIPSHKALVSRFWNGRAEPSVDIFLPICGENISLLDHTWENVSRLKYANKRVYVLDDSHEECEEHKLMAEKYGFVYFARPNRGWMKKAGNLRYAFERTAGDFITIFDADFAPHPDFLRELLPYMDDPKIGIVQSPQYFEMSEKIHNSSPLEYGAAYVQESFYRYIQVARDYFGGAICCGSNAIYRRKALDQIGGPVLIEHSEDAITGFTLTDAGWRVRYVPIILAVGVCPDDVHAYFHQQHRWCTGSLTLLLDKKFWKSRVSWKTKACYFVGFLYYISTPLSILLSFQLFYSLFVYNQYISFANGMLFYPYIAWTFIFMMAFPIYRFRWGCFLATFIQLYSYSHAVFAAFLKSAVGWIPTNTKYLGISKAFKQATLAASIYVFMYLSLIGFAVRTGMFHLFNYNYYAVQFWLLYNVILSSMLLWYLYRTMEHAQAQQVANGTSTHSSLRAWQLKTAGVYIALSVGMFFFLVYS